MEWSDYTLSRRCWAQVVTDIGTGKSPVMKTVREAFKQAVVSELQSGIRGGPNAVKFILNVLRCCAYRVLGCRSCSRIRKETARHKVIEYAALLNANDAKPDETTSTWLAGPADMEHNLITESTHAAFNARLQQGEGHGLLVGPEGSAFLYPGYAKSGKFTRDSYIVLTRLLEAAHGGRYDDTQADVLARPAKARKVAGHEEKVDCGVHFEATNVGMVLLQQPSVLSTWWAPSEARHKIGLANRSSAFHD